MKVDQSKKLLGLVGLVALLTIGAVLPVFWTDGCQLGAGLGEYGELAEESRSGARRSTTPLSITTAIASANFRQEPRTNSAGGRSMVTSSGSDSMYTASRSELRSDTDAVEPKPGTSQPKQLSEEERARKAIRCKVLGRITRRDKPVSGATILLHDRYEPGAFKSIKSDAQGRFQFDDLRYGVWAVSAQMYEAYSKGAAIYCDAQDKEVEVDIKIQRARVHVTGLVSDRDGNQLDGAILDVGLQNKPTDKAEHSILPVPPDGHYDIWVSDDEPDLCITARAPGHQSRLKTVPANKSEVVLNFRLTRESIIRGEVLGSTGLAAGVKVAVSFERPDGSGFIQSQKTDARGRFSIETRDAKVTLSAWSPEEGWANMTLPPRSEGKDVSGIILELQPGRNVTGTVRLQNGKRVPLAEIIFYCKKTSISSKWQASSQGDFVIPNLPPDLPVMVSPWNDKRPFNERYIEVPPNRSTVELVLHPQEE